MVKRRPGPKDSQAWRRFLRNQAKAIRTWGLFHTLRVNPAVVRLFAAEEGVEGKSNVVMINYGYWQRMFGGSADAAGSMLIVNGGAQSIAP